MNAHNYLIICLLLVTMKGLAQQELLHFEFISQEQGLPDNSAWGLCEDHLGLLWIGTQMGLVCYDGHTMKVFDYEPDDTSYSRIKPVAVRTLTEDVRGDLWVGTAQGEVFRFDRETKRFIPYFLPNPENIQVGASIRKILVDSTGQVWLAKNRGGLARFHPTDRELFGKEAAQIPVHIFPDAGKNSPGKIVWDLALDQKGRLWLTTDRGLVLWLEESDHFQIYPLPDDLPTNRKMLPLLHLAVASDGSLWLAGWDAGALQFDPNTEKFEVISIDTGNVPSTIFNVYPDSHGKVWLFDNGENIEKIHIYNPEDGTVNSKAIFYAWPFPKTVKTDIINVLEDHNGLIWVANHHGGLLKYRPEASVFQWLRSGVDELDLALNTTNHLFDDGKGSIWIATSGHGLIRWHLETNSFSNFRSQQNDPHSLSNDVVFSIASTTNDRNLWIVTARGIDHFDPMSGQFTPLNLDSVLLGLMKRRLILDMVADAQGGFWLTYGQNGILYYHPESGNFCEYSKAQGYDLPLVDELFLDSNDNLWIGTSADGFFHFNTDTKNIYKFNFPPGGDFWEDDRQTVWIGTYGAGLVAVDINDLSWQRYDESHGLPHSKVRSVLHDQSGKLWVGTSFGFAHFDPETKSSRNFFHRDGIPGNVFFSRSRLKLKDGRMVFRTDAGLFMFHPDSIQLDTAKPKIIFTDIEIDKKPLHEVMNDPRLSDVSELKKIELGYQLNDLSIRFAAMNFRSPEQNEYQVKLENYDHEWQHIGNQNLVDYPNLDPGFYVLRVNAANSDGIWNEEGITLSIVIKSPWFWNSWSQTLYLILLLGGIIAFYRFQLHRRMALAEANRLRELDEVKTKLYTNITHEFRTPLTVIQGISSQIKGHEQETEIIQRNSQNLLDLVNRMLDLAKAEAGKLKIQLQQGDILPFLRYITESFHSLALQQKINLNFYSELEHLEMDYDPEKILQVLANLIGNAIKFTNEYGKVTIIAQKIRDNNREQLILKIRDTGIGIQPEELPLIFDRFHQTGASSSHQAGGTGIGLALTKELVELMNGEILVESRPLEGSLFTLILPITNRAERESFPSELKRTVQVQSNSLLETESSLQTSPDSDSVAPRLLIVEDNLDVSHFIATCLQKEYELIFARNGQEGIDRALEHIPDIIISDVMMPKVDGFELCHKLKQEERTSHIPIILLTAKADIDSKLEGLEYGADAYLVKPFHQAELEVRLRKLIELRLKLQNRYNQLDFKPGPAIEKEDAFVWKVRQLVWEHLEEDEFGPDQLSEAIFLHRSHLHRKLKALTGKSTSIFIRQIRLQEGHRLLKEGNLQVKEVAFAVGFSDPGYFSKVFSEEFGYPPSMV